MLQPKLSVYRRVLWRPRDVLLHRVCHRPAGRYLRVLVLSCVLNTETRGRRKVPALQSFQPQAISVFPNEWYCLVSLFRRV